MRRCDEDVSGVWPFPSTEAIVYTDPEPACPPIE